MRGFYKNINVLKRRYIFVAILLLLPQVSLGASCSSDLAALGKPHKVLAMAKKGFTLIELLVVVSVIGILAPALAKARNAGRNTICLSNL